jgi:hypothetical protein
MWTISNLPTWPKLLWKLTRIGFVWLKLLWNSTLRLILVLLQHGSQLHLNVTVDLNLENKIEKNYFFENAI